MKLDNIEIEKNKIWLVDEQRYISLKEYILVVLKEENNLEDGN